MSKLFSDRNGGQAVLVQHTQDAALQLCAVLRGPCCLHCGGCFSWSNRSVGTKLASECFKSLQETEDLHDSPLCMLGVKSQGVVIFITASQVTDESIANCMTLQLNVDEGAF